MLESDWFNLEGSPPLESVRLQGVELRAGDRVRLRPRNRADILDLAMDNQTAAIESIEQDYEGGVQVAVVLDDDPGRDLGFLKQPGHRFFFGLDEIEPLDASAAAGTSTRSDA